MPDRKSLISTFWLTSTLVLLAAVLVAPIRTPRIHTASSRSAGFHRTCALPPASPKARLSAATVIHTVLQMKALPSENKVQDRADAQDKALENEGPDWAEALNEPRASFFIPGFFRKVSVRQLIAPPSIISLCPLRC